MGVAEDLMTSHVTWLEVIARCRHELEQDQHRYEATESIELLSAAVCEVFRLRQTTASLHDSDKIDKSRSDDDDDDVICKYA